MANFKIALQIWLSKKILYRSVKTALVVGTILAFINHGDLNNQWCFDGRMLDKDGHNLSCALFCRFLDCNQSANGKYRASVKWFRAVWQISKSLQRIYGDAFQSKLVIAPPQRQRTNSAENSHFCQAHNLKVAGSNPSPATNKYYFISMVQPSHN